MHAQKQLILADQKTLNRLLQRKDLWAGRQGVWRMHAPYSGSVCTIAVRVSAEIEQGSKTWPVAITYIDPDHDLCRLTAEGLNSPVAPVRLFSTLTVGERVYSNGAPEGLFGVDDF